MKVFVTGGTGLLGHNIINELLGRNHSVAALIRPQRVDAKRLSDPALEWVEGDLRDVTQFAAKLADADVLIHAGACYGEYYRKGEKALPGDTNIAGTVALLAAAASQGIRNVVYISSSAVLATQKSDGTIDETAPYAEHADDPYFASKVEAEKAVFGFLDDHPAVRIVLILPSVMLGPGDAGPTPTGSFVLKLLRGQIKFVLPGWNRICDARDVAAAVVESIHRGESGARYLIGGRKVSMAELYETLAAATGTATPTKQISPAKLLFASRLMVLASRLTRRPPALKPNLVKRLQATFSYSSTKAERELGVRFRPLSETLEDTAQWFQTEALV